MHRNFNLLWHSFWSLEIAFAKKLWKFTSRVCIAITCGLDKPISLQPTLHVCLYVIKMHWCIFVTNSYMSIRHMRSCFCQERFILTVFWLFTKLWVHPGLVNNYKLLTCHSGEWDQVGKRKKKPCFKTLIALCFLLLFLVTFTFSYFPNSPRRPVTTIYTF